MLRMAFIAFTAGLLSANAFAQDGCTAADCDSGCGEAAFCSADHWLSRFSSRSTLTGDWGGTRSKLAESGVTFSGNSSQFYFGNVDGGAGTGWRYGGHNEYALNIDMAKTVGLEGNSLKIKAEHRYGNDVNALAGTVLPATIAPGLPVVDSEEIFLTNFLFTQFFSESFGVYFGKLDTLDGDLNAYAHGRGITQFSNTSLITNPALLRVVPYSTLGAGALFILGPESLINVGVLNATDTVDTAGFSELFEEGLVLTAEGRFATNFFGKPGHQLFGGAWSSRNFNSLDQDPRFLFPPAGIPIAQQSSSWALYHNFDQAIFVDPCNPARNWGVFGRLGLTDGNPNPIEYFLSFGVGGSSMVKGREADAWGIGWFQNSLSDDLGPAATTFLGLADGTGIEAFYSYEVTEYFHLTSDVQYLQSAATNRTDDAFLVGFRASIDL